MWNSFCQRNYMRLILICSWWFRARGKRLYLLLLHQVILYKFYFYAQTHLLSWAADQVSSVVETIAQWFIMQGSNRQVQYVASAFGEVFYRTHATVSAKGPEIQEFQRGEGKQIWALQGGAR